MQQKHIFYHFIVGSALIKKTATPHLEWLFVYLLGLEVIAVGQILEILVESIP